MGSIPVGGARKKHLLFQVLFSMKRLRRTKNEADFVYEASLRLTEKIDALRFMFA